MKRFVFSKMAAVFLAAAVPHSVSAQTVSSAPKPATRLPAAPDAGLLPKTHTAQAQTDLLAGVRSHVSKLRAAPLPTGPKSLHENSAQRRADQVKVLHDWQGDPASAGWSFNIGKSK